MHPKIKGKQNNKITFKWKFMTVHAFLFPTNVTVQHTNLRTEANLKCNNVGGICLSLLNGSRLMWKFDNIYKYNYI